VIELELTRARNERRLFRLEGIGTLRFGGIFSRGATAEAGVDAWEFAKRGFWRRMLEATDVDGCVVGEFVPRDFRRGGTLRWRARELTLRPAGSLRERYVLRDGDVELVRVEGSSWGSRPVRMTIVRPDGPEPGLLLFTAFVVRELAVQTANASSAGSTAALSSTSC
jgi:hypothetical protein